MHRSDQNAIAVILSYLYDVGQHIVMWRFVALFE